MIKLSFFFYKSTSSFKLNPAVKEFELRVNIYVLTCSYSFKMKQFADRLQLNLTDVDDVFTKYNFYLYAYTFHTLSFK